MTHEQKEHIIDMLQTLKKSTCDVDILESMSKYEKCIEGVDSIKAMDNTLLGLGASLINALGHEAHAQILMANEILWSIADEAIDFVRAIPEI